MFCGALTAFTVPPPDRLLTALGAGPDGSRRQFLPGLSGSIIPWLLYRLSSPSSVCLLKGNQPCRFPRRAFDTLCLSAPCCSCSGRPHLAGHPSNVYLSSSQKNVSHFEKVLISEPLSKLSTGPSIQSLYMKIDSHSCAFFLAVTRIIRREILRCTQDDKPENESKNG